MSLKRCNRCLLPETHETIKFDNDGVCNICNQYQFKKNRIDWNREKYELDQLIENYRGRYDYDCIVPFSGGKDSTWTLYYLMKEYQLKPLVVNFDHGFLRPNLQKNTLRTTKKLGVDVHSFTPNWKLVRKLMLQSLLERGDFCWHCHTGVFSYPMWIAIKFNIPLIIWGEPSAEYTAYYSYEQSEEVDGERFNRAVNLGINADEMWLKIGNTEGFDKRDLKPYTYPPLSELRKISYRSICLGSYIPWDVKNNVEIIQRELGWQGDQVESVPPGYEYEKIECFMQGVRDYLKYIKRGYARVTHLASLDLRNQRLDKENALKIIDTYEAKRPASLDLFLEFVGLTEEEFLTIVEQHAVSPYVHDHTKITTTMKTSDYDQWPRHEPMPISEAREQIIHWHHRNTSSEK